VHLAESEQLSLDRVLSAPAMLDRARAYLEAGDLAMSDHYIACLSTVAQDDSLYSSALDLLMHYEQQKQQVVRQALLAQQAAGLVAIEFFRRELDKTPENINIALNLLQAISISQSLTDELRQLAQRAVDVIIAGRLPHDQIKRYQVIMSHIQL
jgi:thioredoxin-like negative regulator of GroEL